MESRNIEAIVESLQNGNPVLNNMPNEENKESGDLVRDSNQKLYKGCQKYSKLSFLLRLYHVKCLCGVTDKTMMMILELLKYAFKYANIPNSFYETKKIDVCPRNCMLYWGEDENLEICKHCKKSRWKPKGTNGKKKLFAKVLYYFPLKQRLQKNVCLGLTIDGFNPYRSMSNNYSIWAVMLIPYNRPPWECMKQTSFILSMIIPNVYLQPLIKELNELWTDGVETYDSSLKELFRIQLVIFLGFVLYLGGIFILAMLA
ncbi:hypothetical protein CR513_46007, partial [Mucuna pruriens]